METVGSAVWAWGSFRTSCSQQPAPQGGEGKVERSRGPLIHKTKVITTSGFLMWSPDLSEHPPAYWSAKWVSVVPPHTADLGMQWVKAVKVKQPSRISIRCQVMRASLWISYHLLKVASCSVLARRIPMVSGVGTNIPQGKRSGRKMSMRWSWLLASDGFLDLRDSHLIFPSWNVHH